MRAKGFDQKYADSDEELVAVSKQTPQLRCRYLSNIDLIYAVETYTLIMRRMYISVILVSLTETQRMVHPDPNPVRNLPMYRSVRKPALVGRRLL